MNHKQIKKKQSFKNRWGIPALLVIFIFLILPGLSFGQDPPLQPKAQPAPSKVALQTNPFTLKVPRIAPGSLFKMAVNKAIASGDNWAIDSIKLIYKTEAEEKEVSIEDWYFKESDGKFYLFGRMPGWSKIPGIKDQSRWRGVLTVYSANLSIQCACSGKMSNFEFPVELPDWKWALIWGIVAALGVIFLGSWGITGLFKWKNLDLSLKKMVLSYNSSSVSVSKTQVLIWTLVVLFGIIYVYRISEVLLEITPQVLLFLGIGGATAVGAKYDAVQKNNSPGKPSEPAAAASPKDNQKKDDAGKESEEDSPKPDFFKVQMLTFTLVIAVIVVTEIIKTNAFPVMPENLVVVMGISNAVYLGNKVSDKK